MSTTYADLGTALYDLINSLDITAIYPGGWALVANYPVKDPGKGTTWPVASIQPVEDTEVSLENTSNDHTVTYSLYLYDSFESSATSEADMRQLVDLVRDTLRTQWHSDTPLADSAYALTELSGAWGFDIDLGIRFYRFQITTKTAESTI